MNNSFNFIPKLKAKKNLSSYIYQQGNSKLKPKIRITKGKLSKNKNNSYAREKSQNYRINITNKENINLTNINTSNINIKDSALFSSPRKKASKKKINLPFSRCSNKDVYFKQIKTKKCYIRNEVNIPYNKNNHLTSQNSYYNLINHPNQKMTRDEQNSFGDAEICRKNNSMYSFELTTQNNINLSICINTEFNKKLNMRIIMIKV